MGRFVASAPATTALRHGMSPAPAENFGEDEIASGKLSLPAP